MVNARGYAVQFLGWKLPFVIGKNGWLAEWIFYGHLTGGLFLVGLIVLHVAAALRHEIILKDNVLRRMTPLPLREVASPDGDEATRASRQLGGKRTTG